MFWRTSMLSSIWNKISSAPGAVVNTIASIPGAAKDAVQGVVCEECPACPGITEQLSNNLWNLLVTAKDIAYDFASEHPYIAIGTASAATIGTMYYCTRKPARPTVSESSNQKLITEFFKPIDNDKINNMI